MKFSSKEASVVPVMAVVAAVCHIAAGPIINKVFHVPGPTLAGPVIMAPIMVAGGYTQRRGTLLLTSAINGLILAMFVPIGFLAFPIYIVVGFALELFFANSVKRLASPSYSFLAGGVGNAVGVLLIALIAMGTKAIIPLMIICSCGFVAGGIGGLIAFTVMMQVKHMYPAKVTQ